MTLLPDQVYECEVQGVPGRTRVFFKTKDWSQGDLLKLDNEPVIFCRVELYDIKALSYRGLTKWSPAGGVVVVYDSTGPRTLEAVEYSRLAKSIEVISKFEDAV